MLGSHHGPPGSDLERDDSVHQDEGARPRNVPKGADRRQVSRGPHTDRRLLPRTPKAHLFVPVCHWGMVGLLTVSLLSGMRRGWGYDWSPLGGPHGLWGWLLGSLSPTGTMFGINLIDLHVYSAFLMVLVAGVYVGYMVRSHATRRITLTGETFKRLFAGLRRGQFLRNKSALWSANLLVYWISFLFIGVLAVTGLALYRVDLGVSSLLGGYDAMRVVHALVAYLLIPYTVVHALLQWCFGRFWTIFKAQLWWPHVRAGLIATVVGIPMVAAVYFLDSIPATLTVGRMPVGLPALAIDGDPRDPVWARIKPVTIRTVKGANEPDHTDVTVRAVHDGQYVYFQFQWDDADVSYKRYPLLKTEGGWKVLQTAFERADENVYYEDKLSMYITKVRNGSCASTCHLGVGPASARGEKHGLHYTAGEVGDIWHWKSVRTNPMGEGTDGLGFVDDQYFGRPTPVPTNPKERYTGGYYADPDKGGGYAYNFVKLNPDKPVGETYVRPKFLPPPHIVHTNPDAGTSEQGRTWWIQKAQAIPYTTEADTFPVGSIIPNIVLAPLTGDRADVRGKAAWHEGRWTLEVRRLLDTGSQYDVAFVPGEPVYITVATYNRTQTRHGEHITPVRVLLRP